MYIFDSSNNAIPCRALLDSASQCNLISQELFNRLNLPANAANLPVAGLNQGLTTINKRTTATLSSTQSPYTTQLSLFVIKSIPGLMPQKPINVAKLNLPTNIRLADPNFGYPSKIDLLLGANVFFETLKSNRIKLGRRSPILQETEFGYVVAGDVCISDNSPKRCLLTMNMDIHKQLERFWTVEDNYTNKQIHSKEEAECEEHFVNTVKRDHTGRFVVKLPLKNNINNLGDSYKMATTRFLSQERR